MKWDHGYRTKKVPLANCFKRKVIADILDANKKARWLSNPKNAAKQKEWSRLNGKRPESKAAVARWKARPENTAYFRTYQRKWRENTDNRLLANLRCRLWHALKGRSKTTSVRSLVGCSVSQLVVHLESQFTAGMTWANYGQWHVDHIKPCVKFDMSKPEEQMACFHFTNLQPLWAVDNISKGGR